MQYDQPQQEVQILFPIFGFEVQLQVCALEAVLKRPSYFYPVSERVRQCASSQRLAGPQA
jgi:recombinational DNA repair protein (RecF pathway)